MSEHPQPCRAFGFANIGDARAAHLADEGEGEPGSDAEDERRPEERDRRGGDICQLAGTLGAALDGCVDASRVDEKTRARVEQPANGVAVREAWHRVDHGARDRSRGRRRQRGRLTLERRSLDAGDVLDRVTDLGRA